MGSLAGFGTFYTARGCLVARVSQSLISPPFLIKSNLLEDVIVEQM